jgi:hypothetical protein
MLKPKRKATKLKKASRIKALNISGDFSELFSPSLENALLFLYRGRKDWIRPVTQKKLIKPAINKKTSKTPICSAER